MINSSLALYTQLLLFGEKHRWVLHQTINDHALAILKLKCTVYYTCVNHHSFEDQPLFLIQTVCFNQSFTAFNSLLCNDLISYFFKLLLVITTSIKIVPYRVHTQAFGTYLMSKRRHTYMHEIRYTLCYRCGAKSICGRTLSNNQGFPYIHKTNFSRIFFQIPLPLAF